MRSWRLLPLLCGACVVLRLVSAQCDVSKGKASKLPFPDIEALVLESYQMSVEYTPGTLKQTDYYVEYYDKLLNRGSVEIHAAGKSWTYMYKTYSWEAWEISSSTCKLLNITDTPEMAKGMQNDWLYIPPDQPERRTIGPSAMFKIAFDAWKTGSKDGSMAYMGPCEGRERGINCHYWRRCDSKDSFVDYSFAIDKDEEDPYGYAKGKKIPLRVFFGGKRTGSAAVQQFEILTFQPYIALTARPFELPKRRGCKRGYLEKPPTVPDFSKSNLMFSAEVIYRKIDRNGDDAQYWSYYSTLMMALDRNSQHISYFYTPWDTKKTDPTAEPDVKPPVWEIFDMKHHYMYQYNLDTGNCSINRQRTYYPTFTLPENAGTISLTDTSVLFPESTLSYLSEGVNRGLKVNVFEATIEGHVLDNSEENSKMKTYITHSYLKDDEIERNTASIKNALTQVQMVFSGRQEKVYEILTFNFFGFTTEIEEGRQAFNIKPCFRNDDDYQWVTIAFSADQKTLQNIKNDIPSIQKNLLSTIRLQSELNAVRIPIVQVDFKEEGLYVSLQILGRPPVLLDYLDPEPDKMITGSKEQNGIEDDTDCATRCLESEDNCWGFSICGAVCTFGVGAEAKVGDAKKEGQKECKLYRRFDNETFVQSTDMVVDNLRKEVADNQVHLMLPGADGNEVQLDATSIEVTDPGEDDRIFDRIGNKLNPRMRVLKTGYKIKDSKTGTLVRNLGKLRYDECQRICLDYQACETMSYCLTNSECFLSRSYGDEVLKDEHIEADNMCNILTRQYADHFGRSPGNVLSFTAEKELEQGDVEGCARACLQEKGFSCLSFDHCPTDEKKPCKLHTLHYPNPTTREKVQVKATNCGHYFRKYSTEFKRNSEKRTVGVGIEPINNLNLEECAKTCMELKNNTCFGFDFCQDKTILDTTCTILSIDTKNIKMAPSPICTNFQRDMTKVTIETKIITEKRPFSNSYAGGIAFLCFLVGSLLGAGIVFGIAYLRVNRRS